MRKVHIQMNMTLDGFVAGPQGQLDWMLQEEDFRHIHHLQALTDTVQTILLGRKMATESIPYWENVAAKNERNAESDYARFFVKTAKIIFSKTRTGFEGRNAVVEQGDLAETVRQLTSMPGKDIIAYGGAHFVSALLEQRLADELNLFIHPVAIGEGLAIFTTQTRLELILSESYSNGIVLNRYRLA